MNSLDAKDKAVLKALTGNARRSIQELSKAARLSRDVVAYRMKRMEQKGVIRVYNPILDPSKIGFPVFTFINIALRDFDNAQRRSFEAHLKENPYVVYGARTVGSYHYIIAIAAKTLEHFDTVFGNILEQYAGIIKEYDASSIIDEFKYDTYYDLVGR